VFWLSRVFVVFIGGDATVFAMVFTAAVSQGFD